MKIIFPGGIVKEIKPLSCNSSDLNGDIKCCLVLEPILSKSEAKRVKDAAAQEIQEMQNQDFSDEIASKQMIVDSLNPLLP